MLLKGKVAAISGAAGQRGIGLATARLFASHGASVAILDLDEAGRRWTAAASLSAGSARPAPSRPRLRCRRPRLDHGRGAARPGRISASADILINNAGISQPVKTMEIEPADWDRILDVNLRGVLNLSQAFIPHFRSRKAGTIACMSSVSAQRGGGIFGGPHYAAAKAGVLGLAKAMARELGPDGIRVNCVTPGLVETDITGDALTPEMKTQIANGIPLGRLGAPDDIAGVYLFLASDLSRYVTGAVIDVNGGMLIHG